MSTQINVTVGSGGLSDKAKQLQSAARQAQLEKERQQRVEAEGTEQRNAKLEAEGKAPDGSPLYGARFNQPQIDRRPAAFRRGEVIVSHLGGAIIQRDSSENISLVITRPDGQTYNFTLATTFAYPSTDSSASGISAVAVDSTTTYNPPEAATMPNLEYYTSVSTGRVASPPPINPIEITTTETKNETFNYLDAVSVIFPINKKVFIYATAGKGVRARATAERINTAIHTYPPDTVDGGFFHNYEFPYSQAVSFNTDTYEWAKCFVADESSLREIDCPIAVQSALDNYITTKSPGVNWIYADITRVVSRINGVQTTETISKLGGLEAMVGTWSTPTTSAPYWYSYGHMQLASFLATNSPTGRNISTPGTYAALLADPDDARFYPSNDSNMNNVEYIVNNFYGGNANGLPAFGLQSVFVPYSPSVPNSPYYRHDSTKTKPVNNANIDPNLLKQNRKTITKDVVNVAWDWGKASYCRQQALALGFSEADLTP